jgi:uracil-DNA glycosylase
MSRPIDQRRRVTLSESTSKDGQTAHFNGGSLPVAFVFSVPGERELKEGRPVAGVTGENLSFSLEHLHAVKAALFESVDRYEYRITNSWPEPMAKSLGTASQPNGAQVLQPANVSRVVGELRGCTVVVLCGARAQLLFDPIRSSDMTVGKASHTSNQALNSRFRSNTLSAISSATDRRRARAELWAKQVLRSIARGETS